MRVLIVKTSSMGDVIHTLPALSDAAKQVPEIHFDWLVEEAFAEIPAWHAAVTTVIPVALRRWRKSVFSGNAWRELRDLVGSLRVHRYDCVIDAQSLIKSAVLTRLALGQRCGMDDASCREPLAALAYQQKYHVSKKQHAIQRIRQLFEQALNYKRQEASLDYGLNTFRWRAESHVRQSLVFVHSASRPEKLWPIQQWIHLGQIANQHGYAVLLLWGNENERERAGIIADHIVDCELLPRMRLTSIVRLFQQSTAVVAVDTGLSHLAAAIGVPAVTLYFQTSPRKIGTRGQHQYHMTMTSSDAVSAADVWAKTMYAVASSQCIR